MALWLYDHMMAVVLLPGWYVPPGRKSPDFTFPFPLSPSRVNHGAAGVRCGQRGPLVALTADPESALSPAVRTRDAHPSSGPADDATGAVSTKLGANAMLTRQSRSQARPALGLTESRQQTLGQE